MNYFELFKLPFQFEIDLAAITETFRQLQREVHPDKFANAGERQQLLAVQRSAEVNDGYQTLKHPLSRAQYMLAQRGVDLRMEQQTLQDPAFLMQQMEYREQLEQLAQADDPDEAIEQFSAEIEFQTQQFYQQLQPLVSSECQQQLQDAANLVRKLKFMHKLSDELSRLEDSLF